MVFLLKFCEVIVNIFPILLNNLWLQVTFYIKLLVHIYLNKMGWLRAIIDILLKQLTLFYSWWGSSIILGDVVLTTCYLINHMPSSSLDNKISFHFISSWTSSSLTYKGFWVYKLSHWSHKCVYLGFTRSQKGYKCFSPSLNRYFVYVGVTFNESCFYFKSHSYSTESPSNIVIVPSIVNILVLCDLLGVPCSSLVSSPPLIQVYNYRHRPQQPSSDSTQVPIIVSPPDPTIESPLQTNDLPIALRKGICSTRSPFPYYIAWSYNRLSSPFYICLSSISSVTIAKYVHDALAHPCLR